MAVQSHAHLVIRIPMVVISTVHIAIHGVKRPAVSKIRPCPVGARRIRWVRVRRGPVITSISRMVRLDLVRHPVVQNRLTVLPPMTTIMYREKLVRRAPVGTRIRMAVRVA